jgi:phosphopentomutase
MRRAIIIVLDGCGAGSAPDYQSFDEQQPASTLLNVWNHAGGFRAPHLEEVGFLAAAGIGGASGRFARLEPKSLGGKDSVTGHWEMMGVTLDQPFPTYPDGFPDELLSAFSDRIGRGWLENRPASGTAVIARRGAEHLKTGKPIIYTSADSVFQIAVHEDIVPKEQLYEWCLIARELCQGRNNVQRVIARPFIGEPGAFVRTERRKDFPFDPPQNLADEIGDVYGIGVVPELFGGRGFRDIERTQSNSEHIVELRKALASDARLIFANFEDFDMLYGHRNNPSGFAKCLEEFDVWLGEILASLKSEDLLMLTSDHGNDPTTNSTDHSREYVPLAIVGGGSDADLGDKPGFSCVGASAAAHLGLDWPHGISLID